MKPKFKDFALPITGRRYQILFDPNCPDVTYDELTGNMILQFNLQVTTIWKECTRIYFPAQ